MDTLGNEALCPGEAAGRASRIMAAHCMHACMHATQYGAWRPHARMHAGDAPPTSMSRPLGCIGAGPPRSAPLLAAHDGAPPRPPPSHTHGYPARFLSICTFTRPFPHTALCIWVPYTTLVSLPAARSVTTHVFGCGVGVDARPVKQEAHGAHIHAPLVAVCRDDLQERAPHARHAPRAKQARG